MQLHQGQILRRGHNTLGIAGKRLPIKRILADAVGFGVGQLFIQIFQFCDDDVLLFVAAQDAVLLLILHQFLLGALNLDLQVSQLVLQPL